MANAPTTIGNFQLLRTLGEGGMGVVYEAEHVTMHRRAAIKVLRSELMRDPQAIRRFFNEARATNEIRHPGIVQIYDCGTIEDGSPWLIMELLEGETLSRRISRLGPMPGAEVIGLGAQAASVLEAAHKAGIIHRDLKPDNLFVVQNQETESGERVKVLDFGIAKLTQARSTFNEASNAGCPGGNTRAYCNDKASAVDSSNTLSKILYIGAGVLGSPESPWSSPRPASAPRDASAWRSAAVSERTRRQSPRQEPSMGAARRRANRGRAQPAWLAHRCIG